jgi:hypothetical protein
MFVFCITFHKEKGKFDQFYASHDSASSCYDRLCASLLPGESVMLLQIKLSSTKTVSKLREMSLDNQGAQPAFASALM